MSFPPARKNPGTWSSCPNLQSITTYICNSGRSRARWEGTPWSPNYLTFMGNSGKMLVIWSIWPPSANSNPKSKIPRFIPVWGQFKICSGKQVSDSSIKWAASSEFGTYRLCEQWRFRRACVSAQSRQNLRCSLIQEPSDRKPDPYPLWTAGHAQLQFVKTECSKTQIRLTRLKL